MAMLRNWESGDLPGPADFEDFEVYTPPIHDCADFICKHGQCWLCLTSECFCVE